MGSSVIANREGGTRDRGEWRWSFRHRPCASSREDIAPYQDTAETPAGPDQVDVNLNDPRPLVVAEADAEPLTEQMSALDTLVDLAVTQPRGQVAQVATTLPGPMTTALGIAPLAPRCLALPTPPCPWILTTIGHPGDVTGIRIIAPLHPATLPAERPQGRVTISAPTQVDVGVRPPVMQDVKVAVSVGTDQGVIAGAGAPVPSVAIDDSPSWAERIKEWEEELRAISSSSESDEGGQDPAGVHADPSYTSRPPRTAGQGRRSGCA